ncbi:MAG TPA: hypothetical protein VFN28_15985 [Amaricoccus sp.]|jgi:hypothetical protein|nr:hypothetical protein [Amaricoccus sp.]
MSPTFMSTPFEAIREDLGLARSPLASIRTAAHAAIARHRARRASAARHDAEAVLAAILGAEDPFPALRYHR